MIQAAHVGARLNNEAKGTQSGRAAWTNPWTVAHHIEAAALLRQFRRQECPEALGHHNTDAEETR
jgi:hypothetical protein